MIERKFLETSYGNIQYLNLQQDKPKLIYLHGAFGGPDPIVNIIDHLGHDKYNFIAPFLPGHGDSFEVDNDFNYSDMVACLEEFFHKIDVKDAVVIGHSLGGRLVLDSVASKISNTKKIVMLAPLLNSPHVNFPNMARLVMVDFILDGGLNQIKQIDNYGNKLSLKNLHSLKNIWRIVKSVPEIGELNLATQVLIMSGNADSAIPVNKNLIRKIKNVNFKTYSGHHYWFLNNTEYLNEI